MKGTAWRLYLGIGALATGVYYLLPDGARAVLNVVVGASAAAAIAAGTRWHRPGRRLAWWLVAAAQGLFVVGDALSSVNELALGIEPFPSLADALYLPGYPSPAVGLALLALSRSVLSYDLERAKQRMLGNPTAVARVEHAQATLSTEVQGLRELMASLRPPTLDEVGLEEALRDHVGAFARRSGMAASVRVDLDDRLDGELETVVYRVDLEIGDDGVGLEPVTGATLVRQGHFGLVAMQERVEMAGGRFQLDTRPGAGVVLRAEFRVPPAA
jgi:hypothetical protein